MCIAPNATTILRRAGTRSIQAAWNNYILGQRLNVFYCNHVPPPISKIILVDKASPLFTNNRSKPYTSLILHLVTIFGIWLSVARIADYELVQMRVLPPHDDLKHLMQMKERHLA